VDLEEVQSLYTEAAQRILTLAAQGGCVPDHARIVERSLGIHDEPALGEDERTVRRRHTLQRLPDDLLGMAHTVRRRCVDPVDTRLDGSADSGDRLSIILRAPAKRPFPHRQWPKRPCRRE